LLTAAPWQAPPLRLETHPSFALCLHMCGPAAQRFAQKPPPAPEAGKEKRPFFERIRAQHSPPPPLFLFPFPLSPPFYNCSGGRDFFGSPRRLGLQLRKKARTRRICARARAASCEKTLPPLTRPLNALNKTLPFQRNKPLSVQRSPSAKQTHTIEKTRPPWPAPRVLAVRARASLSHPFPFH
jgi:hypothetical protein